MDLNGEMACNTKSADYLSDIEKVYSGGASKPKRQVLSVVRITIKYAYGTNQLAVMNTVKRLKEAEFTRINIVKLYRRLGDGVL